MNTVVRHDTAPPLLANVATDLAADERGAHSRAATVCQWAAQTDAHGFFERIAHPHDGAHAANAIPLKTALLAPANLHRQAVEPGWSAAGGFAFPDLAGKTVFLGGAWGDSDNFFTALSERSHPGVFIHAAAYSTLLDPVRVTSHARAFAIDIVIGTMLGFLFHAIWSGIQSIKKRVINHDEGLLRLLASAFRWRVVLLLGWVPPLVIVFVFFWWSALLLSSNSWLNPGPLVLGMFIDAVMAAKTRAEEGAEHDAAHDQPDAQAAHPKVSLQHRCVAILRSFPDLGWQLLLIGFTVFTLLHSH
jgi:hypothetical protein